MCVSCFLFTVYYNYNMLIVNKQRNRQESVDCNRFLMSVFGQYSKIARDSPHGSGIYMVVLLIDKNRYIK